MWEVVLDCECAAKLKEITLHEWNFKRRVSVRTGAWETESNIFCDPTGWKYRHCQLSTTTSLCSILFVWRNDRRFHVLSSNATQNNRYRHFPTYFVIFSQSKLSCEWCVGKSTDGAPSMTDKHSDCSSYQGKSTKHRNAVHDSSRSYCRETFWTTVV